MIEYTEDEDAIIFLTVAETIDLHADGIHRYSPTESLWIRDNGLLESAVMTPQQSFDGQYLYSSIAEMAAAYLIGLSTNHAFQNGNKRVAYAACSTFLRMNGYKLKFTQDEAVTITLKVINHEYAREDIVELIGSAIEAVI